MNSINIGAQVLCAASRARLGILTMALTYGLAVIIGMAMVHAGNEFALAYRDNLVARARANDPSLRALREGNRWSAALWDFGRNLLLGAVPNTIAGLSLVVRFAEGSPSRCPEALSAGRAVVFRGLPVGIPSALNRR